MKEKSLAIHQMYCWTRVQGELLRGNIEAKSEAEEKESKNEVLKKRNKRAKLNKTRTLRQIPAERLLLPQHPPQRRDETKDGSRIRVGSRPNGV